MRQLGGSTQWGAHNLILIRIDGYNLGRIISLIVFIKSVDF